MTATFPVGSAWPSTPFAVADEPFFFSFQKCDDLTMAEGLPRGCLQWRPPPRLPAVGFV